MERGSEDREKIERKGEFTEKERNYREREF